MLRRLFDNLVQRPEGVSPAGCDRARLLMLPHLDGDLKAADRGLFEAHLAQCSACRAELAAFRSAESALGAAGSEVLSPGDLRPEFYARLEQSRRSTPPIGWKLAAPALAGIAVIGFLLHSNSGVKVPGQQTEQVRTPASTNNREASLAERIGNKQSSKPAEIASILPSVPKRDDAHHKLRPLHTFVHRQELARAESSRLHSPVRRKLIVPVRKSPSLVAALSASDRPAVQFRSSKVAGLDRAGKPSTYDYALATSDAREAEAASTFSDREESRTVLASLVTEVHVSDENRDFMSSTHVDAKSSRRDAPTTLRVDDENESAAEPVELPPLP